MNRQSLTKKSSKRQMTLPSFFNTNNTIQSSTSIAKWKVNIVFAVAESDVTFLLFAERESCCCLTTQWCKLKPLFRKRWRKLSLYMSNSLNTLCFLSLLWAMSLCHQIIRILNHTELIELVCGRFLLYEWRLERTIQSVNGRIGKYYSSYYGLFSCPNVVFS